MQTQDCGMCQSLSLLGKICPACGNPLVTSSKIYLVTVDTINQLAVRHQPGFCHPCGSDTSLCAGAFAAMSAAAFAAMSAAASQSASGAPINVTSPQPASDTAQVRCPLCYELATFIVGDADNDHLSACSRKCKKTDELRRRIREAFARKARP